MTASEELGYRVTRAAERVSIQAECTVAEALVMMNERAQVQRHTLIEIADGVLENRIRFGV